MIYVYVILVEEKEAWLFCMTFRELIGGGGMVEWPAILAQGPTTNRC